MYVFTHTCPYTIIYVYICIWPSMHSLNPRLNQY